MTVIHHSKAHARFHRELKITGLEVFLVFLGRHYNATLAMSANRTALVRAGIVAAVELFNAKPRTIQNWLREDGLPESRIDQAMEIIREHGFPLCRHQLLLNQEIVDWAVERHRQDQLCKGLAFRGEAA